MPRRADAESLEELVKELVRKHSRIGVTAIGPNDRITSDCGLDSMALLDLVLDLEDRLGLTVPEDDMPRLVGLSFGEFVDYLRDVLARGAGEA